MDCTPKMSCIHLHPNYFQTRVHKVESVEFENPPKKTTLNTRFNLRLEFHYKYLVVLF